MNDDAVKYLLNFAMTNSIGFEIVPEMKPDSPSFAVADKRFMVINPNWYNKHELPFQIAHEIGHILNGDAGVLYYSSPASNIKIESDANITAIDLLIDYCKSIGIYHVDVYRFMERFALPSNVKTTVIDRLENKVIYY